MKPIHHINFDINLLGDCDVVVAELAHRAGWVLNHKMIPEGQTAEIGTVDAIEHTFSVKVQSSVQTTTNGAASNETRKEIS